MVLGGGAFAFEQGTHVCGQFLCTLLYGIHELLELERFIGQFKLEREKEKEREKDRERDREREREREREEEREDGGGRCCDQLSVVCEK